MKLNRPVRKEESESIIPLINIVFLLLIFFMVTAQFNANDDLEVYPPQSLQSEELDPEQDRIIFISSTGKISFRQTQQTPEELGRFVGHVFSDPKQVTLTIKADAKAQTTTLLSVLKVLKDANVGNVELMTLAKQ
ncbi:MAG: biopolymer transporter ExbD [Methylocystaceae bacterium]|nr:biopolymer transporter ExbD [Methylocystaceae bacterium]